ncbi:MAG: DUF4242 domain-containing protein [Chloroflexi bacterium]|nr:DUF4242 domain-containing protein [Chloroflexota bacterium]
MPVYLDHHKVPQMTPQQTQQVVADIHAGKVTNGIKPLNAFIGANDAWCLVEAPTPQAVHDLHKAVYGLDLGPGDVVQVNKLV